MSILGNIRRFFFQKASTDFDANEAFRRNQLRYNALYALDPDVLVRHLAAFNRGDICGLERVLEEFEAREDKMRIGAFKMAAAVSSKPWEVRAVRGEEDNPRAKLHRDTLTRFWNRIEVTDAFCRNRKGGLRLLAKQMMEAQSRVYSVHDIAWRVNADGTLDATFTHVPAWCFENRTGRLRYIRNDGDTRGEEMREGEWLVTVGEGVGIAAAILAMAKRLSWNDWLLFSEKCGMPVVMGNTSAQQGSPAWEALARAIKAVAPKTGILADTGTQLNAVSMGAGGQTTYREMVETVDRAISALYRGGDLATVSSVPSAAGVNAQEGESELMDADGCALVAETLRDQVEKFVIRFVCGDFEPLAGIVVNPPAETLDTEREIRIDQHLAGLGVRLSKADALARYGRIEAKDEGDAMAPAAPAPSQLKGSEGERWKGQNLSSLRLFNSSTVQPDRKVVASPLLAAFARDTGAAAERMAALLDRLDAGEDVAAEARKLAEELPGLMKGEPEMAAVLEEEMARAFAVGIEATKGTKRTKGEEETVALANVTDANGMEHADKGMQGGGRFVSKDGGGTADGNQEKAGAPRNDGKITFGNSRKKEEADAQARKRGYKGIDDLMEQSASVPRERIDAILKGGDTCAPHEAVAVLRSGATIQPPGDEQPVKLGEFALRHYVCGERRGSPDIDRLKTLPAAISAIRAPNQVLHELDDKPVLPDDKGKYPSKTQTIYKRAMGKKSNMAVYAYTDSGVLSAWHVE